MNRLQKREAILKDSVQIGILDICQSVKNGMDGMADEWTDEEILKNWCFLQCCLDTWEPSIYEPSKKYDDCVKRLVIETIELIRFYSVQRAELHEPYKDTF